MQTGSGHFQILALCYRAVMNNCYLQEINTVTIYVVASINLTLKQSAHNIIFKIITYWQSVMGDSVSTPWSESKIPVS
jgi:hypothetical protein